ncbi:hypothetical protein DB333_07795 [Levilactobacillus brevis]|nr:hypothetical protein DB333_07795 [Levilactobacillus brevis]
MVNTILKEADLFCPNSVRINFTIYHSHKKGSRLAVRLPSKYLLINAQRFHGAVIAQLQDYWLAWHLLVRPRPVHLSG